MAEYPGSEHERRVTAERLEAAVDRDLRGLPA